MAQRQHQIESFDHLYSGNPVHLPDGGRFSIQKKWAEGDFIPRCFSFGSRLLVSIRVHDRIGGAALINHRTFNLAGGRANLET